MFPKDMQSKNTNKNDHIVYSIYIIYIIYILYGNFFLLNNKEQITLNVGTNIIVAL